MSILGFNNRMVSQNSQPFFGEFKKQASSYIKEKIKTARLALTDVTPAQLMTEEATNGNPWAPDAKTMGLISRAAFDIDDYWRIVEILHSRLANFDKKNWRPSYNALVLLDHLMTHGPESVANEFQDEKSSIREMQCFNHVDEKGFNWGLALRKKSERILELLEKKTLLKQERDRARKVTREIQGFGSFSKRVSSSKNAILQESMSSDIFGRSHSQFNEHSNNEDDDDINILPSFSNAVEKPASILNETSSTVERENSTIQRASSKENMAPVKSYEQREVLHGWSSSSAKEMNSLLNGGSSSSIVDEDDHYHPFGAIDKQSKTSLLGGEMED
ncbi:hypothetical protein V2J09_019043 [Rumex salicifolius]